LSEECARDCEQKQLFHKVKSLVIKCNFLIDLKVVSVVFKKDRQLHKKALNLNQYC